MDFSISIEVEKHLNNLINNVKCSICSNLLLTPVESTCHHVACAKCFLSQKQCFTCNEVVNHESLRPNEPTSKRTAAVLQIVKAYEVYSGKKVLTGPTIENDECDNSEDWFVKDKKFSKKYEKKKKELSDDSKLLSFSQSDTPIIFPGEDINNTPTIIVVDKNPSCVDKVQEWLSISQLNVGAKTSRGPVDLQPGRMHKNFFSKKTFQATSGPNENDEQKMSTRSSKRLSKSPIKDVSSQSSIRSSDSSTPFKLGSKIKTKSNNSTPNKSYVAEVPTDTNVIKMSTRASKRLNLQTKKPVAKQENSPSPAKKPVAKQDNSPSPKKKRISDSKNSPLNSSTDSPDNVTDTPKSVALSGINSDSSFKANDSKLKNIFSKILSGKSSNLESDNKVENQIIDAPIDKNSWKNVRKMKKVLNKPIRPHPKKLDISVAERNIPLLEYSKQGTHLNSDTPLHIEQVISQSIRNTKNVTPEAIRRCPSVNSTISNSFTNQNSPKKTDKDYLACQAAILASKQQEMCLNNSTSTDVSVAKSDFSGPPVTHLTPVSNDKATKVGNIVKKIEAELAVRNILKDFEDEYVVEEEEDDVSMVDITENRDSIRGKNDLKSASPDNLNRSNTSTPKVAFVQRGRLQGRSARRAERRVPFYYKSKCTADDWYAIRQDGVNIKLQRDNIVTSIFIRNQPIVNITERNTNSVSIVQTRDAQTSPIHFSQEIEEIPNNQNSVTNVNKSLYELPSLSYKMHPNLQRYANFIVPSVDCQSKSQETKNENLEPFNCPKNYPKETQNCVLPKTDNNLGTVCVTQNSETSSPPLIVSEPSHDTLFDVSKKRKYPQTFSPIRYFAKKQKRQENNEYPIKENVDIIFTSQSELSNNHQNTQPKLGENSESINCDALMTSVMANIDRDLALVKDSAIKNDQKLKTPEDLYNIEEENIFPNQEILDNLPSNDNDSFIPTQRKVVEDETDLRIVSMDMELEAEPGAKTVKPTAARQICEDLVHNTPVEDVEHCVNSSKTIIESNNKQFSEGVLDSLQIKESENMFNTMYDKNTIGFSQESENKSDAQIFSTLNLPQSMQQLRSESIKANEPLRHGERTVELSPHEQLLLTPSMKIGESLHDMKTSQDLCTPAMVENDSDASIVEDTPQKPRKFSIIKKSGPESSLRVSDTRRSLDKLVDPPKEGEPHLDKQKSDTPMSISKFTDNVKVCSTPVVVCARRSLSYKDNLSTIQEYDDELISSRGKDSFAKQSSSHTATYMEKQFLEEAFETSIDKSNGRNSTIIECTNEGPKRQTAAHKNIPSSDANKQTSQRQPMKNICVACSCLSKAQIAKVKSLVSNMEWKFTAEYVDDLTHLIVKVDENNRSQRSIKYVQALSAGKWIVSFDWIEKCIATNSLVSEDEYEVLDSSGEMGPYISRTRASKIFEGFTFYCLPPFSVISIEVLHYILKAAGGTIVDSIEEIEVRDPKKVSLLLAESTNTEDDRFLDMMIHHKIVPINFDWVTECLGEGILCNAGNNLLVPRTLLPDLKWSINLATEESMEIPDQC